MSEIKATHWYVLGAGAIGCLWAARLVQAGHSATLLLRDETALLRFQGHGARVMLIEGDEQQRIKMHAEIAAAYGAPISHLLVTTKAHQTRAAIDTIRARIGTDCSVLLLQNGMGIQHEIDALLPQAQAWIGVSTDGAFCPEHFTVVHAGRGITRIGTLHAPRDHHALLQSLTCALDIRYEPDIETALWQKLLVNCAINPLTAIYHCRNGELLTDPTRHEHLRRVCSELSALLHAMHRDDLAQDLIERAEAVAQATAKNRSSMLADVEEKRLTEIDYITGYVCHEAARLGIAMPENEAALRHIRALHPA